MALHHLCPRCGYNLIGIITATNDAYVRCSECGTLSALSELGSSTPPPMLFGIQLVPADRTTIILLMIFVPLLVFAAIPAGTNCGIRVNTTFSQLRNLQAAMSMYEQDCGAVPDHQARVMPYLGDWSWHLDRRKRADKNQTLPPPIFAGVDLRDVKNMYWQFSDQQIENAIASYDPQLAFYPFGDFYFAKLTAPTDDPAIIQVFARPDQHGQRYVLFADGSITLTNRTEWPGVLQADAEARFALTQSSK